MPVQISTDPEHIAISKSRGIEIDWKDGHHSSYGLTWLRDWCPCAQCTGAHGTEPRAKESAHSHGSAATSGGSSPFQMYKPRERMVSVEPVGAYALRIVWSDGHGSGIYSWTHLRQICPCNDCQARN
jgi:DUF971 family protein